jgi:hypothetical protein
MPKLKQPQAMLIIVVSILPSTRLQPSGSVNIEHENVELSVLNSVHIRTFDEDQFWADLIRAIKHAITV